MRTSSHRKTAGQVWVSEGLREDVREADFGERVSVTETMRIVCGAPKGVMSAEIDACASQRVA